MQGQSDRRDIEIGGTEVGSRARWATHESRELVDGEIQNAHCLAPWM